MNRRHPYPYTNPYPNPARGRGGRDESHWSHSGGEQRYASSAGNRHDAGLGQGGWDLDPRYGYGEREDRFGSRDFETGGLGGEYADWGPSAPWNEPRNARNAGDFGRGSGNRFADDRAGWQGDDAQDFGGQHPSHRAWGSRNFGSQRRFDEASDRRPGGGMDAFGDGGRMAASGGYGAYGGYGIPAGGERHAGSLDWLAGDRSAWGSNGLTDQPRFGRRTPKGYTRSDERIKDDLCERLYHTEDVDVGEVTIEVRDGTITLEGSVPERRMKHRIEDIAEQCIGVHDVENRIRIVRGEHAGDRNARPSGVEPSAPTAANDRSRAKGASGGASSPH